MLVNIYAIPKWDNSAVIPAIDFEKPTSADRSPYQASLLDLVRRFGHTTSRRRLLTELLDFRSELHTVGLVQGFQWLDGSFAENVEVRKDKDPSDIDLITFFYDPSDCRNDDDVQTLSRVLNHNRIKKCHKVDHYHVSLNELPLSEIVSHSAYWYSLFSHRRDDYIWKGFVQVDLADHQDAEARTELETMDRRGG